MQEVPGKREGSILYLFEGYTYHADKRYEQTFRCSTRRKTPCPAVLRKCKDQFVLEPAHTHKGDPIALKIIVTKQSMLELSRDTQLPPKEIFDTLCRKYGILFDEI